MTADQIAVLQDTLRRSRRVLNKLWMEIHLSGSAQPRAEFDSLKEDIVAIDRTLDLLSQEEPVV